jgi:hypothetical protein
MTFLMEKSLYVSGGGKSTFPVWKQPFTDLKSVTSSHNSRPCGGESIPILEVTALLVVVFHIHRAG